MQNSFFLKVAGLTRFKAPIFTQVQIKAIGGAAIDAMNSRLDAFANVNDQPAKPYSSKGPVYIPISGRGKTKSGEKRNKSTLGGREVLTAQDLRKMQKLGLVHVVKKGKQPAPGPGQIVAHDTGKSVKFENYAAYKKAIGRSGNRDLYQSGKMRGAIAIVKLTGSSCTIGFTRSAEELKAEGNQKVDPWFGLSPTNKSAVIKFAKSLTPAVVQAMLPKTG